ncbi:glycosyltransferase [Candidatus Magnetomorum sp. HK-1]|nr:glycosyltransferase [Candidatus Magnetomorum sp. HK-1]
MFNYPLGVSEIIIETALNLANKGFFVDIFIDHKFLAMSPISFNNEKIRVFPVQSIDIPHLNLSETLSSFPPNYFKYIQFNKRFPHFSLYIKNILMMVNDTKYDILIGVEPLGLVSSYIISCLYNIPLIYYNMELYQLSNCRTGEAFLLKKLEIDASQKCVFSVLPDKYRTAVFIKENNVPEEKIRYLPISTGGEPIYEKGNYFREKFNIPAWKKILIYAGNIASWAMCEELVEAGSSLPEEYVMVLHFWRETTARDSFLNKLKQKASSNIYFSLQPLPRDLFIKAISSADAGLMFYRPIDENFTEIGSSSNKLSIYLKAGLPVIASDFKSVKEIFDRYKCGECATSPYEMKLAIDLIFKNYTKYKEGALKAFSDHYNFDKNFSLLLHEITNII